MDDVLAMAVGSWLRRRRWWAVGAVGLLLAVVGTARVVFREHFPWPPSVDEMRMSFAPYPRLGIGHTLGNCGSNTMIDGEGWSWHESGCEARSSGWSRGEQMETAKLQSYQEALAELSKAPAQPLADRHCRPSQAMEAMVSLRVWLDAERYREWWPCPEPADNPAEVRRLLQVLYPPNGG